MLFTAVAYNFFIATDRLTFDNITVAQEKGHRNFKTTNKLDWVHVLLAC